MRGNAKNHGPLFQRVIQPHESVGGAIKDFGGKGLKPVVLAVKSIFGNRGRVQA